MPHYKDWYGGRFSVTEYPDNTDEHWGAFETAADVANTAAVDDWTAYTTNDAPDALSEPLYGNLWDSYSIPRPDAFAIMADPNFASPTETDFMIWDVTWNGNVGDIAGVSTYSLTLAELTDVNTTPYTALQNVYFQVDFTAPTVPEPSAGLLLSVALTASLMLRSVRRFLGFSVTLLLIAIPVV